MTNSERNKLDEQIERGIGNMILLFLNLIWDITKFLVVMVFRGLIKLRYIRISDLIYILISIGVPSTILHDKNISIQIKSLIVIITPIVVSGLLYSIDRAVLIKAFNRAGLKGDKLRYFHTRYENDNKVCCIGLSIPNDKIISRTTFLSQMLNYNIIDINVKSKLGKFRYQEIILSKKQSVPKTLILLERLYYTLFSLIDDINDLEYTEELTKINVSFNSEKLYRTVKSFENELSHRCKISENNLSIDSHFIKDYQIKIKKDIKFENDLLKLYKDNKSEVDSKTIPWISGYKESNGALKIHDLKSFIHLIIAGASGNGKSNILHTLLLSILLSDKEIEIIICDPKRNEFKAYKKFKNIQYYNSHESIVKAIKQQVVEMNSRNKKIEPDEYIRDIDGYNKKYTVNKMKYRVIIIDEIADIILNPDKKIVAEFSDALSQLTQLSRSIGFRLVLSTQNPTKEVLKKFIKANIQSRVALGTSNKTDSRTILDNNLASEIEMPGKFVLQFGKDNSFHYSPFVADKDLVEILNYINQHSEFYGVKSNKTLEVIEDKAGLREKILKGERVEIDNSKHLYKFYINLNLTNNILPVKKEIQEMTGLSEHMIRKLHDELKKQGLLSLIDNQKLKVIDINNELEVKRLKKEGDNL